MMPTIDLAPGERLHVLVDLRGLSSGTKVMLRDLRAGWDLLEFRVGATAVDGTVPTTLSSISRLVQDGATRTFSFDGMSKINGPEYDMNRIDFQVPLGSTELCTRTWG